MDAGGQQLWLALAVKWLAGGASIQQVASNLGYESVPSFVTMFRKVLGTRLDATWRNAALVNLGDLKPAVRSTLERKPQPMSASGTFRT